MGNFRQWCSSSISKLKKTDKTNSASGFIKKKKKKNTLYSLLLCEKKKKCLKEIGLFARMCNTEAFSLLTLSSILLREIATCFIIVSYKRNTSSSLFNRDL